MSFFFFFFNDTATTEIYTLSLHDALPILTIERGRGRGHCAIAAKNVDDLVICAVCSDPEDRKSTRLNSSHANISYAVFCLKKKIKTTVHTCIYFQRLVVYTPDLVVSQTCS